MPWLLDDQPLDVTAFGEGDLEAALKQVQAEYCPSDRLIVRLRCDGADVAADSMTRTLGQPASSFEKVELFTSTRGTLVREAMTQASTSLRDAEERCRHAGELINEGRSADGIGALGECVPVWHQVHEALAKSINMLELQADDIVIEDHSLEEILARPRELLLQVKQALEQRDSVMLADLLLYDFAEATAQWQLIVNYLIEAAEPR